LRLTFYRLTMVLDAGAEWRVHGLTFDRPDGIIRHSQPYQTGVDGDGFAA
jgi:hypothetical protein